MEIINRVQNSGLIQIDLEDWVSTEEIITYDIKQNLFQGIALKEKDFRIFIKENDWSKYTGKNVCVISSVDAIIPTWAYMLLTIAIQPYAKTVITGNQQETINYLLNKKIQEINPQEYQDCKIVIKGCSKITIPQSIYTELTKKLMPYAKTIMYGEPCSTVPLYKRKSIK